ncbi:MAG: hypothetical protein AB7R00_15145 [Kofleriaceae bacterium]
MQPLLTSLNEIPGVLGSMIFNAQDSSVAHVLPPRYEPHLMTQVLGELRSVVQSLSSWSSLDMLVVGYQDGQVILRRVDDMTILVLAAQNLNMMKLGIAFLSASAKLGAQRSASPATESVNHNNNVSATVGNGPAVGQPVIDLLQKAFAKHIGPFAKVVLNEELGKMGAMASTIGHGQYDELVKALGNRLPDAVKRREFLAEAAGLVRR